MTEKICELIYKEIDKRFKQEPLDISNLEFSDNFAELLEKLIIIHIRMWKMEDMVNTSTNETQFNDLKRKIQFIFKNKRPRLLKTINLFMDAYITNKKAFDEEELKIYGEK